MFLLSRFDVSDITKDEEVDKENYAPQPLTSNKPVNAFHESLLQATRDDDDVKSETSRALKPLSAASDNKSARTAVEQTSLREPVQSSMSVHEEEKLVENLVTPPREERRVPTEKARQEFAADQNSHQLAPPNIATPQELSIIAEDEEPLEGPSSIRDAFSPKHPSPIHMPHHSFKPPRTIAI